MRGILLFNDECEFEFVFNDYYFFPDFCLEDLFIFFLEVF